MNSNGDEAARLIFAFTHDLRGYLRTVTTRIELAQRAGQSSLPQQAAQWLTEASAAANGMSQLIGAMVAYCGVSPSPETLGLSLIFRALRVQVDAMLHESGVALLIDDPVDVHVSRGLTGILQELVTNSCRFRRPDTRAEIHIATSAPDTSQIDIVVTDNGTGLKAEYLEKLFQPFRRMHARDEFQGFGLGLARCRSIAEANGGSISAFIPSEGGLGVKIRMPARGERRLGSE